MHRIFRLFRNISLLNQLSLFLTLWCQTCSFFEGIQDVTLSAICSMFTGWALYWGERLTKSQQQSKCEPLRFLMSLPNFHVQVRKVTKNDGWTRRWKTEQTHSDLFIHTQTFFLHVSPPSHRCFDLFFFFFLPPGELAELPCSFSETSLEGWICFGDYAAALEPLNSKVPRMNPWVQHGSNL